MKKEQKAIYNKTYRDKHKGEESSLNRIRYASKKLKYHIVYALPNFNNTNEVYCGVTQNPYHRFIRHNGAGNNTENWFILDVVETKKEAMAIERSYHNKGYKGMYKRIKNNKI
mgnify:CR=1 FL=1